MGKFTSFEEIQAWQKARELVRELYRITEGRPLVADFGLRDQIRRAGISVMANVAEGFERGGNKEFLHFLSVAKASAGEVRSHLYVALDQRCLSEEDFKKLTEMSREISKMLSGLMRYLRSSPMKGVKFADSPDS